MNMKQEIQKLANNHNYRVSIPSSGILVSTGKKRKRYSIWKVGIYRNEKYPLILKPSKKVKDHLGYCNEENVLEFLRSYLSSRKNCFMFIEVGELSEKGSEDVPDHRIIKFGKYKYMDVDSIIEEDHEYAHWLVSNSMKRRNNYDYFNKFDRYVLSKDFLNKLYGYILENECKEFSY
jgi:hypothetical protein